MPSVHLPQSITRESIQKLFKSLSAHVHPSWRGADGLRIRSGEAMLEMLFPDAPGAPRKARVFALEYARLVFKRHLIRLQMVMKCRNGWVLLYLLCRLGFTSELEAAIATVMSPKPDTPVQSTVDPEAFISRYSRFIDPASGEVMEQISIHRGLEMLLLAVERSESPSPTPFA